MATRSTHSSELGSAPIDQLLVKMAVPASIGILVLSINFIVDTIFVGRFVGTLGIAAITVVLPISFLISSIGMAIGVGGGSMISRFLGADKHLRACLTFSNMITLTLGLAVSFVILGSFFEVPILKLFGGQGNILAPSQTYFRIVLYGVPALAWAMMSNNTMRAEGKPKMAMLSMMIPAVTNVILDPILIIWLDMGLEGAAWATTASYYASALFTLWFFIFGGSELTVIPRGLKLRWPIVSEIGAIGGVTLARQGTVSLLTIVLNNTLFAYGGELAVAVYGIANRILMFANFPVLGITQGFLPIAGYNYGAKNWQRVKDIIYASVKWGTLIAMGLFAGIMLFARPLAALFTTDPELLAATPKAIRFIFLLTPLIAIQLLGSAYFQAAGKARPALLLTLTKQGFFPIPLVLLLPLAFGLDGVWYAFPVADFLAAAVNFWYLRREVVRRIEPRLVEPGVGSRQSAVGSRQ